MAVLSLNWPSLRYDSSCFTDSHDQDTYLLMVTMLLACRYPKQTSRRNMPLPFITLLAVLSVSISSQATPALFRLPCRLQPALSVTSFSWLQLSIELLATRELVLSLLALFGSIIPVAVQSCHQSRARLCYLTGHLGTDSTWTAWTPSPTNSEGQGLSSSAASAFP